MAEIKWTKEAENWLRDIHDHIALDSPRAAYKLILSIYERVQILRLQPSLGYRYRNYPEHDIRVLLYGHYRIVYLIKKEDGIDILGVFHGALEIEKYLFNN